MKIIFAGSPTFSVKPLLKLIEAGKDVVAVVTQPDKCVGRKAVLTPTPVKQAAQKLGLPVYDWDKISRHTDELKSLGADIMITCAYGQILTRAVIDTFPMGIWNIHASLLPKYRGASPIQSAILGGESVTGITVMRTELSLDTGDMLLVKSIEIGEKTFGELSEAMSELGADAVLEAVELLEKGDCNLLVQDDSAATLCKKITKQDAKIDFSKSAEEICLLVRAMNPSPVAYCMLNGQLLNVYLAKPIEYSGSEKVGQVVKADKNGVVIRCGSGAISLIFAQLQGGKVMNGKDFANGRKIKVGDILE